MRLDLLTGTPGSGKTYSMLNDMIDQPGRYLLCSPRAELIDEQVQHLDQRARANGSVVAVEAIHSMKSGLRGSVPREVKDRLRVPHCPESHRIVAITHETLMSLDPVDFAGWHVRIDEVPDNCFASGSVRIGASWRGLEQFYELQPSRGTRWARVMARDGVAALGRAEIAEDDAKGLAALHKAAQATNRITLIDISNWADAARTKRPIRWWSFWSFTTLNECASVTMTGATFHNSIAYRAMKRFDGDAIEVVEKAIELSAPRANPRISISYFTTHIGSTEWWATDEGGDCLVQISRYLERIRFSGFWMTNDMMVRYFHRRFPGQRCKPKLAGTNTLIAHRSCAAIYSNKAQYADDAAIEVLGLKRDDIQQAREAEDLFQFVMRGAIRDPRYVGSYDVHLYSRGQADALARRMTDAGITTNISIIGIEEAGIMSVQRPAAASGICGSPPVQVQSTAQRKERERERGQRRRQARRDQQIAEGKHRGRGRPKGSAGRT